LVHVGIESVTCKVRIHSLSKYWSKSGHSYSSVKGCGKVAARLVGSYSDVEGQFAD